jgi:hypothetical protein
MGDLCIHMVNLRPYRRSAKPTKGIGIEVEEISRCWKNSA